MTSEVIGRLAKPMRRVVRQRAPTRGVPDSSMIGALGPQPVGLGEVTREVAQVERVRDGGELVHGRLGLGVNASERNRPCGGSSRGSEPSQAM